MGPSEAKSMTSQSGVLRRELFGGGLGPRLPEDTAPWRLDGGRAADRHHETGDPADRERQLGAPDVAPPADEQGAERREAVPGVVVEPEYPPADVIRARELEHRIRVRAEAREEDAGDEEHQAGDERRVHRREQELRDREAAGADEHDAPGGTRDRGGPERADEGPGAEACRDDAERPRA